MANPFFCHRRCCPPAGCDPDGTHNCISSPERTLTATGFTAGPGCGGGTCTLDATGLMQFCGSMGPTYGSCCYTLGGISAASSAWRIECNPTTGNWELLSLYYHDSDPATCEMRIVLGSNGRKVPTGTWTPADAQVNECAGAWTLVLA